MPLGTLDRTPPPFFKQGPSALTKLVFFAALALFLMVADTRFRLTGPLRATVATVLHPVELALLAPVRGWIAASEYLGGLQQAREREDRALQQQAGVAERALRTEQLAAENERLRELLELRNALKVRGTAAELLYEASDPYSRKIVIDRGAKDGIVTASPVVDAAGVLGQVTRVYPLMSEVTLLTDKDAAVPVLNTRTQVRAAAFGDPGSVAAGAGMELRFMASNADLQAGDALATSGIDGVYPPGLPVGRIVGVDRRAGSTFAKVSVVPVARPDSVRHVLVLEPMAQQLPPRPEEAATSAPPPRRPARGASRPGQSDRDLGARR
ncbi:rod shape-determining protein MreC [Rivibacter subsaxonicus]|uniref:Cell shape-determining protein MreC n=1 Tax=Rivibacter subsaxonicus TaxID=457575 RepID=A0A4Q7VW74_9BURK|nr:rod shape-determining protein MreC [Rivibacter subsaxonicus]RZU00972.1 rod shape-determining protein MreC [Rivibacter subsaxonicus]